MANEAKYITLSDDTFKNEVLASKTPILVDFWAAWCGPCRTIAPAIEELSLEFEGRAKVGKLDVENNPIIASQYQVGSIPTLLFFKDGEVVDRVVGVVSKKVLSDKLNVFLKKKTCC